MSEKDLKVQLSVLSEDISRTAEFSIPAGTSVDPKVICQILLVRLDGERHSVDGRSVVMKVYSCTCRIAFVKP